VIVVGILAPGPPGDRATLIARRAAAAGARVEMAGVVPTTAAGDAALVELATASIGHATVIRSVARAIEPADLELALRYLPEVRALVLVEPDPGLLAVAQSAASWSGASLVVVAPPGAAPGAEPEDASSSAPVVLVPPARDPDGTFAGFVAALAVRLDAGEAPAAAWRSTIDALAVDPVSDSA
jgi:hypothetical protein